MTAIHGGNLFALARERNLDWRCLIDFSASINPLGPAPGVRTAIVKALDQIVHYPEKEPSDLKSALSDKWGIDCDQILLGNGATELLYFLARVFSTTNACLHIPVFSEFHRAFPNAGLVGGDETSEWPTDGLFVITRPESPTGRMHHRDNLWSWLRSTTHPVIVDESFIEFSEEDSWVRLVEERPNLIILRSLTKFYALPGLRVGAIIASHDLIRTWQAMREPWQVGVLASAAAVAAVSDQDHATASFRFVREEREWLVHQLQALENLTPHNSQANFIHVQLNYSAERFCDYMLKQGILVRNCVGWPGVHGQSVRVAVRTREENRNLLNAWRVF